MSTNNSGTTTLTNVTVTNNTATDQRGTTRPQNTTCDIGAYELVVVTPTATPTQTPTSTPTFTPTPTAAPIYRSYYYAGGPRVAMREQQGASNTLYYLLSDHLGSGVLTTTYADYGDGGPAVNSFRLYSLQTVKSGGATQFNLQYGYDSVGNVTVITDTTNASQKQTFTYDALNRLLSGSTTAVGSGQYNEWYTYTANGNIYSTTTAALGTNVVYSYTNSVSGCAPGTPAGKPHAVTHLGGVQKYWYDCNGNTPAPAGVGQV